MPEDQSIIVLTNVRLSFPHLFEPHAMEEGQEKKYGAVFLFDNDKHSALLDKIEATIARLALDLWKKKIHFKSCLRDGNEKPEMDGYGDGTMFLSASRKTRPAVVDRDPTVPITADDNKIYAGCYVNATVKLWVQDNKWGKRVNAELFAVQFVKDGESFGAGPVDPTQYFGTVADEADARGGSNTRSRKPSVNVEDY